MKKNTPWGPADHVRTIAEGITRYYTASHGGFGLSAERVAQMPEKYRSIKTWAGDGWYEEDCDSALVVLSFPEYFDEENREIAEITFQRFHAQT